MLGEKWAPFAAQTSNVPWMAILAGRQKFRIGEIGLWRPVVAIAIYIALIFGHPYAFGVSALPNG